MSSQAERRAAAADVLSTLAAPHDPQRSIRAMERRDGALGSFGVDHVLGNLWSRPQLSRRDRSLVVVTFLVVIGSTDELRTHLRGALNHGVERHEVREIVNQVAGYAGFPLAMQATRIVDQVLACRPRRGRAASGQGAGNPGRRSRPLGGGHRCAVHPVRGPSRHRPGRGQGRHHRGLGRGWRDGVRLGLR